MIDQGLWDNNRQGYVYGGDFGEFPHTNNFCCNGLTGPDRYQYPTCKEIAFLQSPVTISLEIDEDRGSVFLIIQSHRQFIDLSDLTVTCTLKYHSHMLELPDEFLQFDISCDIIPAGGRGMFPLRDKLAHAIENSREFIIFNLMQPEHFKIASPKTAWLDVVVKKPENDHSWNKSEEVEVYHCAFEHNYLVKMIHDFMPVKTHSHPTGSALLSRQDVVVKVKDENDMFIVDWTHGMQAIIDKKSGRMLSWIDSRGRPLIVQPLDLCLYRAPTDNDVGGGDISYAQQWQAAGYHSLTRLKLPQVEAAAHKNTDGSIEITVHSVVVPTPDISNGMSIPLQSHYRCFEDGFIDVSFTITPPSLLPSLPRCGVRFSVTSGYDTVRYFGLGPHEAYDDRKQSAYLGVFESPVHALHTRYMNPQENGRRADPRWILLRTSGQVEGLAIVPNPASNSGEPQQISGYGFNVSRYPLEALQACRHEYELLERPPCDELFIHLDSRTMGLGGYDSWSPNVDKEHLILPSGTPMTTRFRLISID